MRRIRYTELLAGLISLLVLSQAPLATLHAAELHVAITGSDASPGTQAAPLRTIQRAADLAQPGDTVTVHAGVYREHVNPPRGGISDSKRIIYQAAPGEEVIITGSEPAKGWVKESGDTWKLTLPNSYFGKFNPFAKAVHGDWFDPRGRVHHLGMVYLNGEWMAEAASHLNEVRQPAAGQPRWYARVDGAEDADYLLNIAAFTIGTQRVEAASFAGKSGELHESGSSTGGKCIGWIRSGSWLRFDKVDLGTGTDRMEFWAATETDGGDIEVRLNSADGELLGKCEVADTGAWSKWVKFKAGIKPVSGEKSICLVFRSRVSTSDNTTIWAQFPGIDPNTSDVEIAKRHTVFTPEKTHIDYITVRGFKLRNAASNWAAPTSGQHGLVTAYWCKGWIIEDNEISYSRCCGIALGKYSDEWDNRRGSQKGYHATIADALKTGGWYKDKIGGHSVRRNHIHHCGQTGIVGSLGCAFSRVEDNEIHDINKQGIWGGAEMAGIKFHGAIDTVIRGNHIYRCGSAGGLWLDWMAQGAQVTGNLIHDNEDCDIFTEVNHGPHVIANNILLSPVSYHSCSPGGAYAHNLIIGGHNAAPDGRETPYHKAHSTEVAGRRDCPLGDVRWYNNLLAGKCNLTAYDKAVLPVAAAGNVFTKGAQSSKFDEAALLKPDFDPGITLTQQADGWYLELNVDKAWATEQKRRVVATEMLGKAVIPDLPFENADGSPLKIDTDYFGKKRDTTNPFPGPFEVKESGKQKIKVWPLASTSGRAGAPNFWDEIPLSPSTRMPSVVLDDYWKSEFQRVNREVAAAQNTRLVFFGDSITEGADSNSAYRRYLDGMLRRDGHLIDFVGSRRKHSDDKAEPDNYEYDVDHEGHWGKGSAWMAENMQRLLASNVPDVAVIHLGTEDILSSNAAAESLTDGILQNIGKVVDALRAKNGNVKIVFSTIIPVKGKESVVSLLNLKISRYVQSNSTLPCPVVIANHHEGFDVSRDLAADGAHPNAAGAGKMARVFAYAIHNMLGSAERKTQ